MQIFRFILLAISTVAVLSTSACAVYEQPYGGSRVVVPLVPVIVAPSWGYDHGYGHRHWRRW